ncbi:MAG: radical SAM protein [Candidatus Omnitrophota bacterium]|nr:radical SAM protein [Candidatus Omnitrophota bacterium]
MKIALVRPPEVNPYWTPPDPPLGIGYLCSYLKANNMECRIFDANFNAWKEDEAVERVIEYRPDLVGFSAMTHEIKMAHTIALRIKNSIKGVAIVVGGCHVTALPRETIQEFPAFNYGVFGEGEKTMLELAQYLLKGNSGGLKNINGLVYRENNGEVTLNSFRQRLSSAELDKLPYPEFNQYYANRQSLAGRKSHYVIMSSRGCPYNCVFCMQVLGREIRRRSPESVVSEIEYAVKSYGAHTIFFADEIFLFNDRVTFEALELMKTRNLPKQVRWRATSRVNIVTEELMKAAKEAGCFLLEMGIESGSNEILKAINKQIAVEQTKRAVEIIKKAGIGISANFILGHPNETLETIKATVNLAVRLNTDNLAVGIMVPYPGTKIFEMAKRGEGKYKLLTQDWSMYDKYGGRALELEGLPLKELEKWQRKALLYFYVKNFRFLDLLKFIMTYKRSILKLVIKR